MDEEKIGAFLDRELGEEERAEIARALEADAGAAARLRLLRRADGALRHALSAAPQPEDHVLAQRILNAEPLRQRLHWRLAQRLAPLAAACVIGVLIGGALFRPSPSVFGVHDLSAELRSVVEHAPSGDTSKMGATSVTIAQSVRTDAGYCREVRITNARGATDALVCLGDAEWRVVVATPAIDMAHPDYETASAQTGPFDSALDALGNPVLVEPSEEAELIRGGWRPDTPR